MRIMHITNDLLPGGVQSYLIRLLPALTARGHQTRLVLVSGRGALSQALASDEITYIPAIGRGLGRKWPRPEAVWRVARDVETFRPDVVQTHLFIGNTVGRLGALLSRTRPVVVGTEHSTYFAKPAWAQTIDRWLYHRSHAMVAVSRAVRDFTIAQEGLGPQKFYAIPLGLSPSSSPPPDPALSAMMAARPTMGTSARLIPEKGIAWFLTIAAQLRLEVPNLLTVVLGDGPEASNLAQHARRLGFDQSSCRLMGYRADGRALLARFDVFVLPSSREGFGLAPLEALAAGVPVVLSRVPAFEELTNNGKYGTLVPLPPGGTLEQWVEAVRQTLAAPPNSGILRQYVAQCFSWDVHVDRLIRLYEQLVAQRSSWC